MHSTSPAAGSQDDERKILRRALPIDRQVAQRKKRGVLV
jgi:hypothetical protein